MNTSNDGVEQYRRMAERLSVLTEAMSAFAAATPDSQRLLDTVARRVAEVIKDYCVVMLLSDDGKMLIPAAAFDPDPDALRQLNEQFMEPYLLESHPASGRVIESGEAFFAPKLDLEQWRPPRTTARHFDFIQRIGLHSLLIVALRVHDRSIGELMLMRFRQESPAFDEHDVELAKNLASHAALAITNARLLAEAQRERAEGKRIADRSRVLSDAAHEFSAATYDSDRLLQVVARSLGEMLGDMCAIRPISDDGAWLESTGSAFHCEPALLEATRQILLSGPQRVGEGLSGRVAASGQALLTAKVVAADFVASSDPRYRPFLEQLGVTSVMTLPLSCQGKVIGVVNLLRGAASVPYTEEDLRFAKSVADHAALALGNARAFAAERIARDVAEKATIAARESEARFARLSDSGIVAIIVADLDGRVFEANDALLRLVGYSRDEILSGHVAWKSLTPPEWREFDVRVVDELTTTGLGHLREKEYIRKDGTRVPVLVGSAMRPGTTECISFVLDLTERKEAQRAIAHLREQRADDAKFRGLLESAPDAMVIVAEDGAIVLVNAQVEKLFGYDRTELIGKPIEILVPGPLRHAHPLQRSNYFLNPSIRPMGAGLDLRARRKDGSEFSVEVRLSPLKTATGLLVSSSIRDITERKQADEHRARLAAIVDSSDDAIIGKTLDGVITSWNEGAHRMFGYAADEVVGNPVALIVPLGYAAEERMILETMAKGEGQRFDTIRRRKDGQHIEVSVTVSPIRDGSGRVVGISKVARDITASKRAEQALAQAKETAEAATRELEAFSYSVAHDLRAPLRGMNGFARVLLDDYAEKLDDEGRDCLQEIHDNAQKMGALIDALLSLSRVTRSALTTARVDLSAVFRGIATRVREAEPQRALRLVVQEDLSAEVDLDLVNALFRNLIENAWKFTAHAPSARIELGMIEIDGAPALFVRDNGVGFDMAHAGKLFAPFQRLHTMSEFPGTGIGLATVQRIVHRHGGRIWAEGIVGEGAVFYFTLPGIARGSA